MIQSLNINSKDSQATGNAVAVRTHAKSIQKIDPTQASNIEASEKDYLIQALKNVNARPNAIRMIMQEFSKTGKISEIIGFIDDLTLFSPEITPKILANIQVMRSHKKALELNEEAITPYFRTINDIDKMSSDISYIKENLFKNNSSIEKLFNTPDSGLPIKYKAVDAGEIHILTAKLSNETLASSLQAQNIRNVIFVHASKGTLNKVFQRYFSNTEQKYREAVEKFYKSSNDKNIDEGAASSVLNCLLRHACYSGVSDIHLLPSLSGKGIIRLKIDGIGIGFDNVSQSLYDKLINIIINASGSTREAIKKEPQDAAFKEPKDMATSNGVDSSLFKDYNFRILLTMIRGDKISCTLRKPEASAIRSWEDFGFEKEDSEEILDKAHKANGLFLVTGPTGSGKTTTLASLMGTFDPIAKSIQTVEAPVELANGLFHQFDVSQSIKLKDEETAYIDALRAFLRNAPDIIMVGEIRTNKVGNIAMSLGNTGHMVFATLHTNSAASAISRLKAMDLDMNLVASLLKGVLAQRLVKKLCPSCKIPHEPSAKDLKDISEKTNSKLDRNEIEFFKQGAGCDYCNYSGYHGRAMIYEFLPINQKTRALIEEGALPSRIEEQMPIEKRISSCGYRLVTKGLVSIEDIKALDD